MSLYKLWRGLVWDCFLFWFQELKNQSHKTVAIWTGARCHLTTNQCFGGSGLPLFHCEFPKESTCEDTSKIRHLASIRRQHGPRYPQSLHWKSYTQEEALVIRNSLFWETRMGKEKAMLCVDSVISPWKTGFCACLFIWLIYWEWRIFHLIGPTQISEDMSNQCTSWNLQIFLYCLHYSGHLNTH